jgi:hypothetical protein
MLSKGDLLGPPFYTSPWKVCNVQRKALANETIDIPKTDLLNSIMMA